MEEKKQCIWLMTTYRQDRIHRGYPFFRAVCFPKYTQAFKVFMLRSVSLYYHLKARLNSQSRAIALGDLSFCSSPGTNLKTDDKTASVFGVFFSVFLRFLLLFKKIISTKTTKRLVTSVMISKDRVRSYQELQ